VINKVNYGTSYYFTVSNCGAAEIYAVTCLTTGNMNNIRLYIELIPTARDYLVTQSDSTTHSTFLYASFPISTPIFLPITTNTLL